MTTVNKRRPNLRELVIPDPGYLLCECDLKGADAQVVAWDAEDHDLMQAFKEGLDVHTKNATDILGERFTSINNPDQRKAVRQTYKHAVHGTNYLGTPHALSAHPSIRWSLQQSRDFQHQWLDVLHPAIRRWHRKIERELYDTGGVTNQLGYYIPFYDRPADSLTKAVAWKPQSVVALVSIEGALALHRRWSRSGEVRVSLQVHDSVVFQIRLDRLHLLREIRPMLHISIPYPDPLVIPIELKASTKSWGECLEEKEIRKLPKGMVEGQALEEWEKSL